MSKYKREFFSEKNIVEGVNEVDLPINGFNNHEFNLTPRLYQLTESDIQRPDMISYKLYNSVGMWWLLMKYNKVEDIWNDLFVGMILEAPQKSELEEYYRSRQ